MINSRKAISKILEDHSNSGDFYDFLEEEDHSPCWEIKIDRERGDLIFLIDANEIYAYPLKKLGSPVLDMDRLNVLMKLFRSQNLKALEEALNGY